LTVKDTVLNDEIFRKEISHDQIKKRLKANKFKQIDLKEQICCMQELSNGMLVTSNYKNISLYDKSFKSFKTLDNIENITFYCNDLLVNKIRNYIYFGDHQNHRIIILDSELNHVKSYKNECLKPCGIDYYNQQVYVCNAANSTKSIYRFNLELDCEHTFQIVCKPFQIKIIDKVTMVRPIQLSQNNSVYFYDTDTFNLIRKYDDHKGTLSVIGLNFYEYFEEKLFCYDINGVLIDELKIEINEMLSHVFNGALVFYNNNLILSSYKTSKLFVFEA
jgi:hypothetical protein